MTSSILLQVQIQYSRLYTAIVFFVVMILLLKGFIYYVDFRRFCQGNILSLNITIQKGTVLIVPLESIQPLNINYLCTHDLYSTGRNIFDAGSTLRGEVGGGCAL